MSFGSSDHSHSGSSSASPGDRRVNVIPELSMSDLRLVQRLGSGDIGSVYLAELKKGGDAGAEGRVVAAKVMDKEELEGMNKERRARMERAILEVLDHPFLPRLLGAAEDERWSCHLTEFCPGGDLHVLRQRQPGRRFDEAAVRFYAAEVVVALEYMHMMGIIYRDLKPENVLIRSDGHIVITDFDLSLKCDGVITPAQLVSYRHPLFTAVAPTFSDRPPFSAASRILPNCILPAVSCFLPKSSTRRRKKLAVGIEFVAEPVDLRSMSFVGTHEYLAPEIVAGEGHGCAVDWWTLGVFMYELLYGVTPFRGADNEATLGGIVARSLEFPKEPAVSAVLKDLVAGVLVKDPTKRLGSTMGAASLKRHPFFEEINWALLRCTVPPYVPLPYSTSGCSSVEMSDASCPGTPVDYY